MAIYQGLHLARNFTCTYIICYSDSKGVIDNLAKPVNNIIVMHLPLPTFLISWIWIGRWSRVTLLRKVMLVRIFFAKWDLTSSGSCGIFPLMIWRPFSSVIPWGPLFLVFNYFLLFSFSFVNIILLSVYWLVC